MRTLNNKSRIFITLMAICLIFSIVYLTATAQKEVTEPDPFSRLSLDNKDRYFLGEDIVFNVDAYNESGEKLDAVSRKKVKLTFSLRGIFSNADNVITRKIEFDGSLPPMSRRKLSEGVYAWEQAPDTGAGSIGLNLLKEFNSPLGVGTYIFTIRSEAGYELTKEFEVIFDDERSTPVLEDLLRSESMGAQNWGYVNLVRFNRPKLISILGEMKFSRDERLRKTAEQFTDEMKTNNLF